MKQFFGAFFGSIVGIVVAVLLAVLILVVVVKSSMKDLDDDNAKEVKTGSVLKIVMDGALFDREPLNPFEDLGELSPLGEQEGMGLNTLIAKLKAAKSDDKIEGIYLVFREPEMGFASLEELRNVLIDFKKSGKFVYTYGEYFTQKEYYLASAGTRIFMNPQGMLDWRGLHMQQFFFKNTFEKLDLDVQIFRHGKYKSAVEPFMLDRMSDANRKQSESFLNSIWNSMLLGIAREKKLDPVDMNRMADNLSVSKPEDALGKFVDVLAYEDEVMDELRKITKLDKKEKIRFVAVSDYKAKSQAVKDKQGKIAVIYAEGGIGNGEGSDEEIGSDRLARTIREARLDSTTKAVVLRVNSPGGSALASEVIWREVNLCKETKPIVVSMGNVAASGGYYISCAATRIFAQPNTITGSIGVFGLLPSFKRMFENKLGITLDTVNTNKYSDMASGLRMLGQKEYDFIQASVESIYDTFTKRVSAGRGISQSQVDSIGQGRVWSGAEALEIKLVDELGGLDDAVAYAAKKAGITSYKRVELPKQQNPFEDLFGKKEAEVEARLVQKNLGPAYKYFQQLQKLSRMSGIQARLPFELEIN